MSINRVSISGNLTREAELRQTAGGLPVLGFGVAVNDRRKNADGEWQDFPNFVDCTIFGQRAEAIAPYLKKGTKVSLDGKLRWSSWENKSGEKRSKLEVIVEEIEFMTPAKKAEKAEKKESSGEYMPFDNLPTYE